jgi:hypothetical protein
MSTDAYNSVMLILQIMGVVIMLVTACLVIGQLRAATKASRFVAMQRIAELVQNIDDKLYCLPKNVVYFAHEFPDNPPPRFEIWDSTDGEKDIMAKAKEKRESFFTKGGGHEEFDDVAVRAINALNDITQYIEDGYANYAEVLGPYHFKIIRAIHLVEAFRSRKSDENYGHRLLRLRQKAIQYHYMHPKHSDKDVILKLRDKNGTIKDEFVLFPRLENKKETKKIRKNYKKAFSENNKNNI